MGAVYTKYDMLTDDELVREACMKQDITELEVALLSGLEYWMDYGDTLLQELERPEAAVRTKYVVGATA